jgi:uncharacterized protein DUF4129
MLSTFLQGGAPPWPAPAIHDSVAAIIRQRGYQRDVRSSIVERLARWFAEWVQSLQDYVAAHPTAKWIVLGLTILLALLVVARIALGTRLGLDDASAADRRRQRETVADPLAEAERLAVAGQFTDAAHALYRGLLDALVRRDQLRLHPSKTSGDYARELQRRGSLSHAAFRRFARMYDRVLFGDLTVDAAAYATLLGAARPVLQPEPAEEHAA